MIYKTIFSLWFSTLLISTCSQQTDLSVTDALNAFSVQLLQQTVSEGGDDLNIALSPYTVWTLMTIISEGARGNTAKEMNTCLHIPADKTQFRADYRNLSQILLKQTQGVDLLISNAIFSNKRQTLKPKFRELSKEVYNVDITPVDFKNLKTTTEFINNYIAKATHDRVQNFINPSDLQDAEVFMTSTLYFKGDWKLPFNKSATKREPFYNDKNVKIGEVDMMYQTGYYPFSRIDALYSHAVELPYGDGDKMAMVIILPFKGTTISNVLNLMTQHSVRKIVNILNDAEQQFVDEDVMVYLPRFSVTSEFNLNVALEKIGIKDVFDSQKADLLDIFHHYLYVSRLIQKAEIEVDEEGTVASAASGATFEYKTPPPRLLANRPFIYMIVDRQTKSILFTGKISNPNTLQKKRT